MGCVFYRIGNSLQPAPGSRIVRAREYATLLKAQELLDDAQRQAQVTAQKAEEAYEERRQQGYSDGVMEGQMQQAEKMLETGMQAVEYLEGLERQIVEVVTTAVRKIVGEIDEKERIVRVVRTALEQVRGRQRVLIRVSPEDEPHVHEALAPMLTLSSSNAGYEVVADQRMKPGDCTLESEMGVVDASLDVQLKAIEKALTARIGEGNS
ncbi:MAG: HrpE/YscL family type III secretion apparatus protein [Desulfovibrio sp.]|nr:HrpE/YscL family type III secretion apparatus protein [Desulfovibrio sp.]